MTMIQQPTALLLMLCSAVFSTDLAAQQIAPSAPDAPAAVLSDNMADFREAYLDRLLAPFRAVTGSGPGLTKDAVQKARQLAVANMRAQSLMTFFSADLDGDGTVTFEEYRSRQRQVWPQEGGGQATDQLARQFAVMDGNGDGVVTFDEARAAAARNADALLGQRINDNRLEQLLALDPNNDGLLTADELEGLGRAAFAHYDRDGNGILSGDERKQLASDTAAGRQAAMFREQFARCNFPHAGGSEEFFLIDANGAQALSSASLVGQDKVTETAEIAIEPGDKPLYVIALSRQPVIWRLTGEAGRIAHFVAVSGTTGVGVTGLPKAVVTLSQGAGCIGNRISGNQSMPRETAWGLQAAIGAPLRGVVYKPFFSTRLPSGATKPDDVPDRPPMPDAGIARGRSAVPPVGTPPPEGVDADTNAALWWFHPGGLVQIDPTAVIAAAPVVAYDPPPMEAGLVKLMADGAISTIGRGAYIINRPIPRIPAGLTGQHMVNFSLAPGVQEPPGYNVGPPMSPNGYRDLRERKF